MARTTIDYVEFVPERADAIAEVMAELADGSGWLTLDPGIDERITPPTQSAFGRLVSGRGPAVPRANWVPAEIRGRRREPVSVGILHATGAKAAERLGEKDVPVPERWRVAADHSKRGLVLWVPIDVPHAEVLSWTLEASVALTRVPLTGGWRAAIHRR